MDLRCISLHFYYKIVDLEKFEDVFYSQTNFKEVTGDIDKITSLETFEYYSDYYRKIIAKGLEIDENKVISVSCEEYYENTYED
ncbi:TPA: hypothetical protein KPF99_003548 [Clostridioides difficile]|uniref:Uncharacterized protein n=1 Tax=Clostridioides difficile TaxID=1496 RepID=A0A9X8WRT6_CLODI|nr:hypothetical protein [Clostridioides difficile]EKG0777131.1 hypothetical protein [Clostridioides difficile]EKG0781047.1 hypothetical protein [Clostridioides difficile]EKG0813131.1 hypothetical protein [Clostridioides difficile]EQF14841.1 hypothetical protein QEO_0253 [Clostridioides difficile CD133]EQH15577.1 hypothetical protein QKW_3939 [Clostridioides difficile DA00210]